MNFFASCPSGFEDLLTSELKALNIPRVRKLKGQVSFEGDVIDAYRALMHTRLASRVVVVLSHISASTSDELYSQIQTVPWLEHIAPQARITIDASGTNDSLKNTQYTAQVTKDAICDLVREHTGFRPQIDNINPDIRIVVRINKHKAMVGIDLSGTPLFKRGFEATAHSLKNISPLRFDYAAALLYEAQWNSFAKETSNPSLYIAFGGDGTLACEAVSIALNRAPGLTRTTWGFTHWLKHSEQDWGLVKTEAEELHEKHKDKKVSLFVFDSRPHAHSLNRRILDRAGLSADLTLMSNASLNPNDSKLLTPSICAVDLSWLDPEDIVQEAKAHREVCEILSHFAQGSSVAVLSSNTFLEHVLPLQKTSKHELYRGKQSLQLSHYILEKQENFSVVELNNQPISLFVKSSDQFVARLKKVFKERKKWAKKEWVSCYRIYDCDLPDYAVSIDLFQDETHQNQWLYICEYKAPKEIDPQIARLRLFDVLSIAPLVLGIDPRRCYVRVRTHDKGGSQYAFSKDTGIKENTNKKPVQPKRPVVEEGGLLFELDFSEKLDCGLFLDHRLTREMLRELMKETQGSKRFLNLFAYTGSATCYAFDGGAKYTTTVDLSNTYLDWAQQNMRINGFESPNNEFIRADVLKWIRKQRQTKNRWDLIFCDPPTFSNSKSMRSKSFDVQRDHAELIICISRLLTRNGVGVFSCNLRSFKPDYEYLKNAGVELCDITAQTIPYDFLRNPKIHHCYLVKRTAVPHLPTREG